MKDDLSSPSNATKYSYKVYEDGPLTYYHYYFEEVEQSLAAIDPKQAVIYPKLLPSGLSAVGMVAAAFVSGFGVVSLAHYQPQADNAPAISKSPPKPVSRQKLSAVPPSFPEKSTRVATTSLPTTLPKLPLSDRGGVRPPLLKPIARSQRLTSPQRPVTPLALAAPEATPMQLRLRQTLSERSPLTQRL